MPLPLFIDIHTHQDRRVQEGLLIVRSLDLLRNEDSLPSNGYYSLGLHPWFLGANVPEEELFRLEEYAQLPQVIAIGECGLDKEIEVSMELQQQTFRAQCQIAYRLGLPCVLHIVKAWDELFLTQQELGQSAPIMIIHGFRGKPQLAQSLLNKGFILSFGKYYNPLSLLLAWQRKALLLESDTHDLFIENHYRAIAQTLDISVEQLCKTTQEVLNKALKDPRIIP